MKTRSLQSFGFGLALAVLPFVAGCNQTPGGASQISTNAAVVPPAAADEDTNQSFTGAPEMVSALPAAKTLPANIKPSAPLAEVIRLAQAGVEENVMLAFVSSSQSAFNLGSEEIIYLTDIGVDDDIVTAMIERDRTLKLAWAAPSETVSSMDVSNEAPPEDQEAPVATSPTYTNAEPYPVEEPQQVVSDDYFYDNLSPYGSWVYVDDYGWCWQPTVVVVNHSWQPYCDRGRWVYTDCGWYWQSDYSWGLTFHYGRWFNHPTHGWCWWPDRTWSPSWVTWRYNDSYCGWAPLPPRCNYRPGFGLAYHNGSVGVGFNFGLSANCYTFVSWRGFCDSRPSRHRLSTTQTTTIINNTTVVNNIVSGDHHRIVNRGIAPERVTEVAKQPIHRVAVRDVEKRTAANRSWDRNNPDWRRSAAGRSDVAATGSQPNKGPAGASGSSERRERPKVAADNESARDGVNYGRDRRPLPSRQDRTPNITSDSQNVADRGDDASRGSGRGIPPSARNDNPTITAGDDSPQGGRLRNRGSDPASVSVSDSGRTTPATTMHQAPPRSLIIIGKRDENQSRVSDVANHPSQHNPGNSMPGRDLSQERRGHLTVSPSGEEIIASAPQAEIPRPVVARNWSPPAQIQRQQDSRSNQRLENHSENRPSPSVVVNRQPPPAPPTVVQPAAPRPEPQQVAPTPPAPSPAPVQSPPAARSEPAHPSPPANSGHSGSRVNDDGSGRRR